jgi:hypothetical protein
MPQEKRERISIDEIEQDIKDQKIRDIKKLTLRVVVIPLIIIVGGLIIFSFADLLIERLVTKTDPSVALNFFKTIISIVVPVITLSLGYIFGKNL